MTSRTSDASPTETGQHALAERLHAGESVARAATPLSLNYRHVQTLRLSRHQHPEPQTVTHAVDLAAADVFTADAAPTSGINISTVFRAAVTASIQNLRTRSRIAATTTRRTRSIQRVREFWGTVGTGS